MPALVICIILRSSLIVYVRIIPGEAGTKKSCNLKIMDEIRKILDKKIIGTKIY